MSKDTHPVPRPIPPAGVRHFIEDAFVDSESGETFSTLDPATNQPITRVAAGDTRDVDQAVSAARRAFAKGQWGRSTAEERGRILQRVAAGIRQRSRELAALETLDTGLPISQTLKQVDRAAENFSFFATEISRLQGETFPVGNSFLNYTRRKPVGVAGLITPWNTPLMLTTWKAAPALAAGNTCVLKPAEWAPLSAQLLAEVMQEAGVPAGVFNVVHGWGETAGAALVAHPGVNVISFTGETGTGREIMANGAATLKRFSMELGGKSPVVIFADADLERALDATLFGVFSLNGERCTAGTRVLVEAPIYDDFIAALAARTERVRVGNPFARETEVGPLIHPDHRQRVAAYVQHGQTEGARLVTGGGRPAELVEGNFLKPALFADVRHDMRIFREEIFGPVLCAMPFWDEAEAVDLANAVPYGLAAYVWTRDLQRAHRVSDGIDAGLVWINSQNVRDLRTPFGGMKDSGIGREGARHSLEFYTEIKTVHLALGEHKIPRFGA